VKILEIDPWLSPFKPELDLRMNLYKQVKKALLGEGGFFKDFANGHHHFGFHQTDGGWYYREWAPAADALFLIGDFNHWNRGTHPLKRVGFASSWLHPLKSWGAVT
jgi:1,4-alpha-glucan branching enzyme